jgi:hypothetical protein
MKKVWLVIGIILGFTGVYLSYRYINLDKYEQLDDVATSMIPDINDRSYWFYYFYNDSEGNKWCKIIQVPIGHLKIKTRRDGLEIGSISFTQPIQTEVPCKYKVKNAIFFVPQNEEVVWKERLSKQEKPL